MIRFRMDESKMFDAADQCNGISNEMVNTHDYASGSFKGAKETNLGGQIASNIQGQIGSIGNSIGQLSNMVNEQTDTIRRGDMQGAKDVLQIEIPQDFVANNAMKINEFDKSILEKIDGKHVKATEAEEQIEADDESVIDDKIDTFDDVTTEATEKRDYDGRVSINEQQELANINNPDGTDEQKLDDSTIIEGQEEMANINNGEGLQEQELDDSTIIEDVGLESIANVDAVGEQELDEDGFDDLTGTSLGQMNNPVTIETKNV